MISSNGAGYFRRSDEIHALEKLLHFSPQWEGVYHFDYYKQALAMLVNNSLHPDIVQFFNYFFGKTVLPEGVVTEEVLKNLLNEFEILFQKIKSAENVVLITGDRKAGKSSLINYLSGVKFDLGYDELSMYPFLTPKDSSLLRVEMHIGRGKSLPSPISLINVNGITCIEVPCGQDWFRDFYEILIKRCIRSATNIKGVMHVVDWFDTDPTCEGRLSSRSARIRGALELVDNAHSDIQKYASYRINKLPHVVNNPIPKWVVISRPTSPHLDMHPYFHTPSFVKWSKARLTEIMEENCDNLFKDVFIFRGCDDHKKNIKDHRDHKSEILRLFESIKALDEKHHQTEDPLKSYIKQKLESALSEKHPNRALEIDAALKKILAHKGKDIVLVLGSELAGKSTLINYLLGTEFERYDSILGLGYDVSESKENAPRNVAAINHVPDRCDITPVELFTNSDGICFVDTPSIDSKSVHYRKSWGQFEKTTLNLAIELANSICGIISVIHSFDLINWHNTSNSIKNIINTFSLVKQYKDIEESIITVITKADRLPTNYYDWANHFDKDFLLNKLIPGLRQDHQNNSKALEALDLIAHSSAFITCDYQNDITRNEIIDAIKKLNNLIPKQNLFFDTDSTQALSTRLSTKNMFSSKSDNSCEQESQADTCKSTLTI